jgi:hypothetical protein
MSDQRKSQSIRISGKWCGKPSPIKTLYHHHWDWKQRRFGTTGYTCRRWRRRTSRSWSVDYAKVLQSNPVLEAFGNAGRTQRQQFSVW